MCFYSHPRNCCKIFLNKFSSANSAVLSILRSTKSDSWETKISLFYSLAESILLYLSEVWGCLYSNIIEHSQLLFFKASYSNTRCICKVGNIKNSCRLNIFMWGWWLHLLKMKNNQNLLLKFGLL